METIGFKYACKKCDKEIARGKTPVFENTSATCECGGDMGVMPLFQELEKGFVYELWINNKVSGATVTGSIVLTSQETNGNDVKNTMIKRLSEEFARLLTNPDNQKKLVAR